MQQHQAETRSTVAAIVVAAGRGLRAGGSVPKQYRAFASATVVRAALAAFCEHPQVVLVQSVIHPEDRDLFGSATEGLRMLEPVAGGATRQASVRAGLEALAPHAPELVLVHDAARPFVSPQLISRAIEAGHATHAAIPGVPVADTIKTVDAAGTVTGTVERAAIRAVQTPQCFRFELLHDLHRKAHAQGFDEFPDDAALLEWGGVPVGVFAGDQANVKLTTAEDFTRMAATRDAELSDIRMASGFDVHAFAPGNHVTVGGIRIPHDRALTGHSDADVALHALTDAILGTLADGDIGSHFPPSDPQWRGASSDRFLAFAVERVRARGGRIALLDVTLMCEAPKIGPHRDAMRARIAEIAGISIGRVAVKATTTEQLGFTGRREGIAALATATVRLPGGDDE